MNEDLIVSVGDIYELKKPHPCGGKEFVVIKNGTDSTIKCLKCGHEILIDRVELKKKIKRIINKN